DDRRRAGRPARTAHAGSGGVRSGERLRPRLDSAAPRGFPTLVMETAAARAKENEMATGTTAQLDRERVRSLIEREAAQLDERTRASAETYERARRSLSGGVASSYQARDPWPIYLTSGEGPVVHDVDGNRRWDFHNGFGSMVQGHANPAIVRAVRERVAEGTHFAATTEDGILVAEELQRRWGLERW